MKNHAIIITLFLVYAQMSWAEGNSYESSKRADQGHLLQGIPSQWKACASDGDCAAGSVDCTSWDALNKKYLRKLSANLAACSSSIDPGFKPVTACVNKMCQATDKSTDISWEEWLIQMRNGHQNSSSD